jgi:hypothetical protein
MPRIVAEERAWRNLYCGNASTRLPRTQESCDAAGAEATEAALLDDSAFPTRLRAMLLTKGLAPTSCDLMPRA